MAADKRQEIVQSSIDTSVSFEAGDKLVRVDLEGVKKLFEDIDKYNDQFSLGAMIARMIFFPHFELKKGAEPEPSSDSLAQELGNQQVTAFFLISAHKETLAHMGLSLEPVQAGATIMGEGVEASPAQMMLNVSNRKNFTSFLHALRPVQVQATGLQKHLEKIPGILSQQITTRYNLVVPNQEAIELFEGMEQIIKEYKRLGMMEAVSQLEDYYNHGKIGDLREYVSITRRGLLNPPGRYFGPADWQTDSTPQSLEARWDEAIDILERTGQNPKAADLCEQLLKHLIMCVNLALQGLPTLKYISQDIREKQQTVLEVAKQKLEMFARRSQSL